MRRLQGIVLAGTLAGCVLVVRRGIAQRLRGSSTEAADDNVSASQPESTAQAVVGPLQRAASAMQDTVVGAASAVAGRMGRATSGDVDAARDLAPQPVTDPIPEGEPNDPTLVARVESELYEDGTLPKGEVIIDAANGVVTLRGTVSGAQADEFVSRTRGVEGVARVVDLLQRS